MITLIPIDFVTNWWLCLLLLFHMKQKQRSISEEVGGLVTK